MKLLDLLGLGAGAVVGARTAKDEGMRQQAELERQTLLDRLKQEQDAENRAIRSRLANAQIQNLESLARERAQPEVPKPPQTPWQREGFNTEDEYIRFRAREAGATRAPTQAQSGQPPVLTEGERKTGALLQTAQEGYNTLETLLTGDNPATPEKETGTPMMPPTLWQRARASIGMGVGNVLSPQQLRQMDQAAYSLAEGWLRLTSGGAITPQEIENVKAAIVPQPGDDETTLANKARLRQTYINAIRMAAGRAGDAAPVGGQPPFAPAPALSPTAGRVPVTQRFPLRMP